MTLADRIVVLRDGYVEQVGAPMDLYRRPENTFVAGFVGSPAMNFLDANVQAAAADGLSVSLAGGQVVRTAIDGQGVEVGARVTLGVRPVDIEPGNGTHVVNGRVQSMERLGDISYLYAKIASGETVVARASESAQRGDLAHLQFGGAACHVFDAGGRALPRIEPT